jgi:uncharacterized protein YaaN involved in tellurite resistance
MAFSLEITDENKVKENDAKETPAVSEYAAKIRRQAEENAAEVINCDIESLAAKKQLVTSIGQFGLDTMRKSSQKNSLLKMSVGKLSQTGAEGGEVSRGLVDLNREIKNLDPSAVDFTKSGILGRILNPVRAYFTKYEKAENMIANIVNLLESGKKTLTNDNTTLAIEQQALRELSKKLGKDIEMAAAMDALISEKLEGARINDMNEDKIRFIQEEILFPLRQRTMDMQQMIVVNQQGMIAMEVIQRNNKELVRGGDRAKTVTVTALRTAIMVASALYNQKIVLEKINILNETTNNMIAATSKMLEEQGAEIHRQSIESNISVDTLKTAFRDAMDAIDEINTFKQQALPKMQAAIFAVRRACRQGRGGHSKT